MLIGNVDYPACVNYQIYTNDCSLANIAVLSSFIALALVLFLIHKYKIRLRNVESKEDKR